MEARRKRGGGVSLLQEGSQEVNSRYNPASTRGGGAIKSKRRLALSPTGNSSPEFLPTQRREFRSKEQPGVPWTSSPRPAPRGLPGILARARRPRAGLARSRPRRCQEGPCLPPRRTQLGPPPEAALPCLQPGRPRARQPLSPAGLPAPTAISCARRRLGKGRGAQRDPPGRLLAGEGRGGGCGRCRAPRGAAVAGGRTGLTGRGCRLRAPAGLARAGGARTALL